MTKLEAARLLLDFHFAPWGAAKGAIWEEFSDKSYDEANMALLIDQVLDGRILTDEQIKFLQIVTEPTPTPTDLTWAERISAAGSNPDKDAAHADADNLLVNLVYTLGYTRTAAAYSAVERRYGSTHTA